MDVIKADLAVPGSAGELVDDVAKLGKRIDILVNNAGVGSHGNFVDDKPDEDAAMVQLNCVTLVELAGHYFPKMVEAGRGLLINLGSTASFQPTPNMAVYGGTKAFVWAFTERVMAGSQGHRGARADAVPWRNRY